MYLIFGPEDHDKVQCPSWTRITPVQLDLMDMYTMGNIWRLIGQVTLSDNLRLIQHNGHGTSWFGVKTSGLVCGETTDSSNVSILIRVSTALKHQMSLRNGQRTRSSLIAVFARGFERIAAYPAYRRLWLAYGCIRLER